MMIEFYSAMIKSILTSSIIAWYAGATIRNKQRLQHVVHSAEKVIDCRLPSLQHLYTSRTLKHAGWITSDPSHPGKRLIIRQEAVVQSDQNLSLLEQFLPLCCWTLEQYT